MAMWKIPYLMTAKEGGPPRGISYIVVDPARVVLIKNLDHNGLALVQLPNGNWMQTAVMFETLWAALIDEANVAGAPPPVLFAKDDSVVEPTEPVNKEPELHHHSHSEDKE